MLFGQRSGCEWPCFDLAPDPSAGLRYTIIVPNRIVAPRSEARPEQAVMKARADGLARMAMYANVPQLIKMLDTFGRL